MTPTEPITIDQLPDALRAAVAATLARVVSPDGSPPLAINGEITGLLLHEGRPETATGYCVRLGEWRVGKGEKL